MDKKARSAKVSQLIDCVPAAAFDAFVDPGTVTKFWLESTSAPLREFGSATWHFMVPGATDTLTVSELTRPSLIALTWSDGSTLSLAFAQHDERRTRVTAEFSIGEGETIEQTVDTASGYTFVLCDLKTLLESGRSANIVRSKAELITCNR